MSIDWDDVTSTLVIGPSPFGSYFLEVESSLSVETKTGEHIAYSNMFWYDAHLGVVSELFGDE